MVNAETGTEGVKRVGSTWMDRTKSDGNMISKLLT